ncbi:hypothetical protein IWW37_000831 [Coemansia sp. RSA 2050]|nr:hypothetical protein IWW37_000831 [Coemansia sp. RSA 2050]
MPPLLRATIPRYIAIFVITVAILCVLLIFHQGQSLSSETDRVTIEPRSLAIIMPTNNNTDIEFYKNMWVADYLYTVCDYPGLDCSMSCNQPSTWATLYKKTRCFTKEIKKRFRSTEFFIKMDDDTFVDREYIEKLVDLYAGSKKPVYISDFILNLDYRNRALNGSYYGNGKFYMFNRPLLDCIDPNIWFWGDRNEDAVFGAMVHNGCGPDVEKIKEDNSKIWHKRYTSKNKHINLSAISNY